MAQFYVLAAFHRRTLLKGSHGLETGWVVGTQVVGALYCTSRETGSTLTTIPFGLLRRSLYQLTWKSPRAWIYPIDRFEAASLVSTPLQDGWGIANDGAHLILGNSSAVLSWVEPGSMRLLRTLRVQDGGRDVPFLNELEWINGSLWANIWSRECVAQISPRTGQVEAWIDFEVSEREFTESRLLLQNCLRTHYMHAPLQIITRIKLPTVNLLSTTKPQGLTNRARRQGHRVDVLNGIAWDQAQNRLFVTGKLWPTLYEIRLVPRQLSARPEALETLRSKCIVRDTSIFDG